jgi:hypothetical protein
MVRLLRPPDGQQPAHPPEQEQQHDQPRDQAGFQEEFQEVAMRAIDEGALDLGRSSYVR